MLDTRNIDENRAQGSREDYAASETVTSIKEDLVTRYRAGGMKYGTFIDEAEVPTDITGETSFAEMAYNELLDGVTYALKAKKEVETLRAENAKLKDVVLRQRQQLSKYATVLKRADLVIGELRESMRELEGAASQVELLRKQNEVLRSQVSDLKTQLETEHNECMTHAHEAQRLGKMAAEEMRKAHAAESKASIYEHEVQRLSSVPGVRLVAPLFSNVRRNK